MNLFLRKLLLKDILFIIILITALVFSFITNSRIHKYQYEIGENKIEGYVLEYDYDGNKLSLLIDGKEKIKATYYIDSYSEKNYLENNIKYGSIIKMNGQVKIPINNTIPNTFNYKKYLASINVHLQMKIDKLEITNQKISNIIYRIKNSIYKITNKLSSKNYIYTLVLGNKAALSNEANTNYQINGLTHLFALSGMHVSFFSMIIIFFLKKIKIHETKRYIICFIFLILYSLITGMSPSILVSTMFFILLSINKILYLEIKSINIFILSVSILILIFPYYINNLGFQYSIVTTFGLIYSSIALKNGSYFYKLLKTSLVATLFSFPLTVINFYTYNLLSIICNLIFVPLVTLIIYPLCMLTIVFPFLDSILNYLNNIIEKMSSIFSNLSINITVPRLSIIILIIFYIIILLSIKYNLKFLVLIFILLIINNILPTLDNNYYIYYLDVGQGDSILIRSPHNQEIILIDTGGSLSYQMKKWQKPEKAFHISDATITFFKSIGITKIDYLIASHGDDDHMGEAVNIVNNFEVKTVIFNIGSYNELEKNLIKVLNTKRIKYYKGITELNIENNNLLFLNTKEYNNENDNSNVIYLKLNNYKFLFMGDAGIPKENDIINAYNLSNIDFLKIGHHGSNSSSSKVFINTIKPKTCLISVGKNNRYGHPTESVIDILKNCSIYRTDLDGSIVMKINSNGLINVILYSSGVTL